MKADQLFNTFAEGQQPSIFKRIKSSHKRKSVDMTNLSAIHLNPWNDQGSKSFINLQGQNFFSSPKLPFNYSPTYKETMEKNIMKTKQKKSTSQNKNWNMNQFQKNHLFSSKQKKIKEKIEKQTNLMNKTISVHNIQSEKVFTQPKTICQKKRKSQNVKKDKSSRKTIISNPMFIKFCNPLGIERQRFTRRKKTLSDFDPKTIDFESERAIKIKERMTTFSIDKGDANKAKNIHEVRRRLKSNSELSRRSSFDTNVDDQGQNRIFHNEKLNTHSINFHKTQQETIEKQQIDEKAIDLNQSKQISQISKQIQDKQTFKLGQRKNLYIGYRKFFHPLYHVIGKDRNLQTEQKSLRKEFVNFQSLQKVVDLEMIKNKFCN